MSERMTDEEYEGTADSFHDVDDRASWLRWEADRARAREERLEKALKELAATAGYHKDRDIARKALEE